MTLKTIFVIAVLYFILVPLLQGEVEELGKDKEEESHKSEDD